MASTSAAGLRAPAVPEETAVVRGARWYTAAFLLVGVLNYGYALLLTRLLDVTAYARFAAGQGLLLCAATVAGAAVPWALAQSLARARTAAERDGAVRFAIVISLGGGLLVGGVLAAVAGQFAGTAMVAALAVSTVLIFLSTITAGRLQGSERPRTLSTVLVGEAGLKCLAGLCLVTLAGWGDAGAVAAFGVGALLCLFWWPRPRRGGHHRWRSAGTDRDLWRRALGIAGVQGMVAVLGATDLVLVTVLVADRSAAASYQASVVLARVPVFLASAISTAFFPALSRRRAEVPLTGSATGMYLALAVPVAAILMTAPHAVLSGVFPAQYTMLPTLLRFTALAGFAIGGLNLVTTFFQAVDDYRCLWWQAAGLLCFVAALLFGWSVDGVLGLAIGAGCGTSAALALLVYRLVRLRGSAVLCRAPLLEPLALAALLALLRFHPVLWLVAAGAVGLRVAERFLRRSGTVRAAEAARLPRSPADEPVGGPR
jgi:O-antigen/teichoic acid export membrane protein